MVNLLQRMAKLHSLLSIRIGAGAAILPPEVTRLHLDFANGLGGHLGPRQFWRRHLPRLKYHNPAVPMTVTRSKDKSGPATLTIHFTSPEQAANSSPPINSTASNPAVPSSSGAPTTYTKVIECKHRANDEILRDLMELTKAQKVLPTDTDRQLLKELTARRLKSQQDSKLSAIVNAKIRAEKAILNQARGEVAAASAEI